MNKAIAAYKGSQRPYTKFYWDIANQVGMAQALLIQIIEAWCKNNAVHKRQHYHRDGDWWTSASYQEWASRYSAIGSPRTLQRLLTELEDKGYVISEQFDKGKDNTKFYKINQEAVGELLLASTDSDPTVPIWHDDTDVYNASCQIGTTIVPEMDGHDAKLSCSTIYKKINQIDHSILPPTPLKGVEERERKLGFEIPEEEGVKDCSTLIEPKAEITIPTNKLSSRENVPALRDDPFYKKRHDPSVVVWDWLPDGPWKVDGKLDPSFHEALALEWQKEYGGDLHKKKADVLSHFSKNPANLAIWWEWYQSKQLHKVANVKLRKIGGVDTTADEQQIIKHAGAFREMPEEIRVTATRTAEQIITEVAPHALPVVQISTNALPDGAESPESYKVFQASDDYWENIKPVEPKAKPSVDDEQREKARAEIEKLKKRREERQKPKDVEIETPSNDFHVVLEDMRNYIKLGSEKTKQFAIEWASDPKNGCELVKRNGEVVDIKEVEF